MPSASDFRKTFSLTKGSEIGSKSGIVIAESDVGHNMRVQNEKYEYPSSILVSLPSHAKLNKQQLKETIRVHIAPINGYIMYSSYGSPYECSVKNLKVSKFDRASLSAQFEFMGRAIRRRDIPTLAEQTEQQPGREKKEAALGKEIKKYLSGMRVIKSRFATTKCSICGKSVQPGMHIAHDGPADTRGHWAHAECAIEREKTKRQCSSASKKKATKRKRAS